MSDKQQKEAHAFTIDDLGWLLQASGVVELHIVRGQRDESLSDEIHEDPDIEPEDVMLGELIYLLQLAAMRELHIVTDVPRFDTPQAAALIARAEERLKQRRAGQSGAGSPRT